MSTANPANPASSTIPTITICNLKINEELSEDSYCFSATVKLDGESFFVAKDDGNGGAMLFEPVTSNDIRYRDVSRKIHELNQAFKTNNVTVPSECGDLQTNLELYINQLVGFELAKKTVKRLLKSTCCYLKTVDGKRGLYELSKKVKPTPVNYQRIKATDWWGADYVLLNELSLDEATRLINDLED